MPVSRARALSVPVALAAGVLALAACSSGSSGGSSATPTSAAPTSASASASPTSASPAASGAPCTAEALQATVPQGSEVTDFVCESIPDQQWAAGTATAPGGEVPFFAKADAPATEWTTVPAEEICGTASAGLPEKILGYCPS